MPLNLKIINPIHYASWDKLLLSNPDYSLFHSSHWARVLSESYHYNPLYFTLVDEDRLLVSIPIMEIKSFLTGRRGVSLPFSDYCNPIVAGDILSHDVLDYLLEYGRHAGWKFIEIRGGGIFFQNLPHSSFCYGHTLNLLQNEEQIFSNFKSSTKRNIKKAIREGVQVRVCYSQESIKDFYRLNCITRREHGLPPQPYYFFKNIYDHIISKNYGFIVLASYKDKVIAGTIYFHFGRKAIYKFAASDRRYQHLRPSNLLIWEAIKWFTQNNYKSFCFGRTEPENKGLRQFKNGWGASEKIIKYYRYDFNKNHFVNGNSHVSGFHNKVFNKIPVPILKMIGSVLYKHIG